MHSRMRIEAPAKVNLCLSVGGVRPDGYHAVETVLHCLTLTDTLTISPAEKLSVACRPSVGVPEERNLAYRAASAFCSRLEIDCPVSIEIDKRIPHGAGLGGGSSDAAAVIASLAHVHGIERTDPRCLELAGLLGADVAFFLHGAAARMTGRGEKLIRTLSPLMAPVALVKPAPPVPTGGAYAAFDSDPQPPCDCDPVVDALSSGDAAALASAISNNLEVASSTVVPDVAVALAWVRAQEGVRGALLAGSGSAVFAMTEDASAAERIAALAGERGWWGLASALGTDGIGIADVEDVEGE